MAKFEQLNDYVFNTLQALIGNQNLCKLLKYNNTDPLSQPDIEDASVLIMDKIYPMPNIPGTQAEESSLLNIIFDNFKLSSDNKGTKDGTLVINIIVHNNLWLMNGRLRPFSILAELDKTFNDKRIVGIKKMQFDRGRYYFINEKFSGYQVIYQVVSTN
ncbi:hypothetical protein [Paenibacillus medicaginis]|uniref:Uncharacterized protein n=1 Tax=Paenibacillus medicaginis TaxID=1470560 RepID=A0ABV5BYF9_9BACL